MRVQYVESCRHNEPCDKYLRQFNGGTARLWKAKILLIALERVEQNWNPVLRPDTRQNKHSEQDDDSKNFILLWSMIRNFADFSDKIMRRNKAVGAGADSI